MRLKPMKEEVRVYMAPHEYQTYLDHCDRRTRLAARIIGECSPRRGKTANLTRNDFFVPDDPNVELAFVNLRQTKDSTEGENALGGQTRISWVPWDLYDEVNQYCDDEGIHGDEEIFDVGKEQLGKTISAAGEDTAIATGDEDYDEITSHDLRAYYATNMVRRLGVEIETVMEMGGWDSRKAIEPYLATPLPRDLQDELARAGVVQKEVPAPPRNDEIGEILTRLEQIERALELDKVVDVRDLTASDVRTLKKEIEDAEEEAEKRDLRSTKSLQNFINVMTIAGAIVTGTTFVLKQMLKRLETEYLSMKYTTTAPSPLAGAIGYTLGLMALFGPLSIGSSSVFTPAFFAVAIGAVLGSTTIDFECPPDH